MAKASRQYLALDLGAESGRGIIGTFDGARLSLKEVYRFQHVPLRHNGTLRWDALVLAHQLKQALRAANQHVRGKLISLGVDAWGVDYVLLDRNDDLLGYPYHYRDERNEKAMAPLLRKIPAAELYRVTGIQLISINTIFQLFAETQARTGAIEAAKSLLFIPDFLAWSLGGEKAIEYTIASTSQLLDARSRNWSRRLIDRAALPRNLFKRPVEPGTVLGNLRGDVAAESGAPQSIKVVAVGAHDTASAIAAVPAQPVSAAQEWAYISSGTWSLFGQEIDQPQINAAARSANLSNEGGVGGKICLLTNIMGLWLVQELRRAWTDDDGHAPDYATLTSEAASAGSGPIVAPNWGPFGTPGEMPRKFTAFCRATRQKPPRSRGEFVRCALESLALAYRDAKERLETVRGREIARLHIVGGGSKNALLNQFTADACGVEVLAGPEEATAMGNILVQMIADGVIGSLAEGREVVRASCRPRRFAPREPARWSDLFERYKALSRKAVSA